MSAQRPQTATEPSRPVDVHYRRLDREIVSFPNSISFAEALRRVLRVRTNSLLVQDDVGQRVQRQIPNRLGDIRCWNNIVAEEGRVFGTICLYRPAELQAVIQARGIDGVVSAYPLSQIGETNGGDFLRAISYWMSFEDHFYLIQSSSLQTSAMENYFSWLLQRHGILESGQSVGMSVALDRDAIGGDLEDLSSLNVGGSLAPPTDGDLDGNEDSLVSHPGVDIQLSDGSGRRERRRIGRGRQILPNAWDLLHNVMHDQRSLEEVEDAYRDLRRADPNATLDAELEFFVRIRRRTDTGRSARQRALQAISNGLRDLPDGTVTAKGDGGTVRGKEVRLKMPRRIKLARPPLGAPEGAQSSLLDLDHAFHEIKLVHDRFVEDGRI